MAISLTLANQIFGMVLNSLSIGGLKLLVKDINAYETSILTLFVISSSAHVILFLYIRKLIIYLNNQTLFSYSKISLGSEEIIQCKVIDYDLEECTKELRSCGLSICITAFLYFKFKGVSSLTSSSFNILKPLLFSGLVRCYIYKQKLTRPFDKNDVFGKSTESSLVETTGGSVGRNGKKDSSSISSTPNVEEIVSESGSEEGDLESIEEEEKRESGEMEQLKNESEEEEAKGETSDDQSVKSTDSISTKRRGGSSRKEE